MSVFARFTRRTLWKNRTRTLVTVVGIVLSMSLLTAVIEGAVSGLQYLIDVEVESTGAFHAVYGNLNAEKMAAVKADRAVAQTAALYDVGVAAYDTGLANYPYLHVFSLSDGVTDLVTLRLREGRLPQNAGELTVPAWMTEKVPIGSRLTLAVGRRMAGSLERWDLDAVDPDLPETVESAVNHTYTVVGVYEDFFMPGSSRAALPVLTAGENTGRGHLFFTLRDPAGFQSYLDRQTVVDREGASVDDPAFLEAHHTLISFYGGMRDQSLKQMLFRMAAVLCGLIMVGSVSLIYNSFSISLSERTRQFGMLKSIGATNRQICGSVVYEALLLGGVGIVGGAAVGCAGIGLTLWLLRDAFARMTFSGSTVRIHLVLQPWALLAAAVLCLITTLVAALIPARRAIRLPAIEAIRQTRDVKIRARQVRTSPLTRRLFGFEGMMAAKGFRRNRKRYRSTILSLALSVLLFVSASSFTAYLIDSLSIYRDTSNMADVYLYLYDKKPSAVELLPLANSIEEVEQAVAVSDVPVEMLLDETQLDGSLRQTPFFPAGAQEPFSQGVRLTFVDDGAFDALCRQSGLDPAPSYDGTRPAGILYNEMVQSMETDSGRKRYRFALVDPGKLPGEIRLNLYRTPEGYELTDHREVAEGEYVYVFEPTEDKSLPELLLREEELYQAMPITLRGEVTGELPVGVVSGYPAILLPYSIQEAAMTHYGLTARSSCLALRAPDHATVAERLDRLKEERGLTNAMVYDQSESRDVSLLAVLVARVFAYGFILLMSLISMANVFNTISTGVLLRRREFATLKSTGMTDRSISRMLRYECLIYGLKSLLWGLPAAVLAAWLIWRATADAFNTVFYIPPHALIIAVGSIFAVVFVTMLYAARRIRRDNLIDVMKNENL